MADLLRTLLILAREDRQDELLALLQRVDNWRRGAGLVTEDAIVDALGYKPAQGGAGGGSGTAIHEVSSRWRNLMTASAKPFDVPFHNAFTVEALLIDADTGPLNTFDFDILIGGTVVKTITLSSAFEVFTIGATLGAETALVIESAETSNADQLADVSFSFELTPD